MGLKLTLALLVVVAVAVMYVYKKYMNLPTNAKCKYDMQCEAGACGRATAADGATTVCCSGEKSTYAGFDYCKNMPNGAVCWSDAQCAGNYCKDNLGGLKKGKCEGHLEVGHVCDSNAQCINGACARETAADGAAKQCCKSGNFTHYAGFDYCTQMAEGAVCWSDAQCGNGYCEGNKGGIKKGKCRGHLKVNETCESNRQCLNGSCGRESAADGAPTQCCPSGHTALYAGFDYCTQMAEGAVCWSDAQCGNGYCEGNKGGFKKGKCRGHLQVNETCESNRQCLNGSCGRESAADGAPTQCCPSGQIGQYGGFDYCTQMAEGAVCWSDAQCGNSYCEGNKGGFQKGKCRGHLNVNDGCESNRQCLNGACGRKTAADGAPLQCCPSGQIGQYGGYDYCTQMAEGSTCWSDAQCANGYCEGNAGGFRKGTCRGHLNVNDGCESNRQCLNGACGRETAADGAPLQCCPSGQIGQYAGYDYCTQMPGGSTCWSDAQCASGNCKGNWYGLRKGHCK
jgi:hypothetical protein